MVKHPIRVNAAHSSAVLRPDSRINYKRLYEIEYSVRCIDVGLVDIDSMTHLLNQLEPCRANLKVDVQVETSSEADDLDLSIEWCYWPLLPNATR